MYFRTKFQISSIILTSFRQGSDFTTPPTTPKQTTKKPTLIRVKSLTNKQWTPHGWNIIKAFKSELQKGEHMKKKLPQNNLTKNEIEALKA